MTEDADWIRLARYFAGECTPDEAEATRRWIAADPDRRHTAEGLRAAWQAAAVPSTTWDTPASWRRLLARLHHRERRRDLGLVRPAWPERPRGAWSRHGVRTAVVAACALSGAAVLWQIGGSASLTPAVAAAAPLREVRSPLGQRARFQLADGTTVLLAPGSVLRYDTTSFGESTREVQLDGQAHFTVAYDPRHPFMVRTARTVTEDLGTEFVITDYLGDPGTEVVVALGAVAVRAVAADSIRTATVLQAGELARLDRSGRVTVQRGVDLRSYLAWTEGRLVFVDTPLGQAVAQLNRWYGSDVRLGDSTLATQRYTAAYGAASEATVVGELATAIGARVERRGGTIVLVPLSDRSREN